MARRPKETGDRIFTFSPMTSLPLPADFRISSETARFPLGESEPPRSLAHYYRFFMAETFLPGHARDHGPAGFRK